jgi:hypothetical protein
MFKRPKSTTCEVCGKSVPTEAVARGRLNVYRISVHKGNVAVLLGKTCSGSKKEVVTG